MVVRPRTAVRPLLDLSFPFVRSRESCKLTINDGMSLPLNLNKSFVVYSSSKISLPSTNNRMCSYKFLELWYKILSFEAHFSFSKMVSATFFSKVNAYTYFSFAMRNIPR